MLTMPPSAVNLQNGTAGSSTGTRARGQQGQVRENIWIALSKIKINQLRAILAEHNVPFKPGAKKDHLKFLYTCLKDEKSKSAAPGKSSQDPVGVERESEANKFPRQKRRNDELVLPPPKRVQKSPTLTCVGPSSTSGVLLVKPPSAIAVPPNCIGKTPANTCIEPSSTSGDANKLVQPLVTARPMVAQVPSAEIPEVGVATSCQLPLVTSQALSRKTIWIGERTFFSLYSTPLIEMLIKIVHTAPSKIKIDQLRAILAEHNVPFEPGAKKDQLKSLYMCLKDNKSKSAAPRKVSQDPVSMERQSPSEVSADKVPGEKRKIDNQGLPPPKRIHKSPTISLVEPSSTSGLALVEPPSAIAVPPKKTPAITCIESSTNTCIKPPTNTRIEPPAITRIESSTDSCIKPSSNTCIKPSSRSGNANEVVQPPVTATPTVTQVPLADKRTLADTHTKPSSTPAIAVVKLPTVLPSVSTIAQQALSKTPVRHESQTSETVNSTPKLQEPLPHPELEPIKLLKGKQRMFDVAQEDFPLKSPKETLDNPKGKQQMVDFAEEDSLHCRGHQPEPVKVPSTSISKAGTVERNLEFTAKVGCFEKQITEVAQPSLQLARTAQQSPVLDTPGQQTQIPGLPLTLSSKAVDAVGTHIKFLNAPDRYAKRRNSVPDLPSQATAGIPCLVSNDVDRPKKPSGATQDDGIFPRKKPRLNACNTSLPLFWLEGLIKRRRDRKAHGTSPPLPFRLAGLDQRLRNQQALSTGFRDHKLTIDGDPLARISAGNPSFQTLVAPAPASSISFVPSRVGFGLFGKNFAELDQQHLSTSPKHVEVTADVHTNLLESDEPAPACLSTLTEGENCLPILRASQGLVYRPAVARSLDIPDPASLTASSTSFAPPGEVLRFTEPASLTAPSTSLAPSGEGFTVGQEILIDSIQIPPGLLAPSTLSTDLNCITLNASTLSDLFGLDFAQHGRNDEPTPASLSLDFAQHGRNDEPTLASLSELGDQETSASPFLNQNNQLSQLVASKDVAEISIQMNGTGTVVVDTQALTGHHPTVGHSTAHQMACLASSYASPFLLQNDRFGQLVASKHTEDVVAISLSSSGGSLVTIDTQVPTEHDQPSVGHKSPNISPFDMTHDLAGDPKLVEDREDSVLFFDEIEGACSRDMDLPKDLNNHVNIAVESPILQHPTRQSKRIIICDSDEEDELPTGRIPPTNNHSSIISLPTINHTSVPPLNTLDTAVQVPSTQALNISQDSHLNSVSVPSTVPLVRDAQDNGLTSELAPSTQALDIVQNNGLTSAPAPSTRAVPLNPALDIAQDNGVALNRTLETAQDICSPPSDAQNAPVPLALPVGHTSNQQNVHKWAKDPNTLTVDALKGVLKSFDVPFRSKDQKAALICKYVILSARRRAVEVREAITASQPHVDTSPIQPRQPDKGKGPAITPTFLSPIPPPLRANIVDDKLEDLISTHVDRPESDVPNQFVSEGTPSRRPPIRPQQPDLRTPNQDVNNWASHVFGAANEMDWDPSVDPTAPESASPQNLYNLMKSFTTDFKEIGHAKLATMNVIADGVTVIADGMSVFKAACDFSSPFSRPSTSARTPGPHQDADIDMNLNTPTPQLLPSSGPLLDAVRKHVDTLFGRPRSDGAFHPPASAEARRSWVEDHEELDSPMEDADFEDDDHYPDPSDMDLDFDPSFPYPDGPGHSDSSPQTLRIMWDMMRRAGVRSFRPNLGEGINADSNRFLWKLAVKIFMRLVASNQLEDVTLAICDEKLVTALLHRYVQGQVMRQYVLPFNNNSNTPLTDYHCYYVNVPRFREGKRPPQVNNLSAKHCRGNTRRSRLCQWRLGEINQDARLFGLRRVVQTCCSDDETDNDIEVGEGERQKHCRVLGVPWQLDRIRQQRIAASGTKSNAPPTRQRKRVPNPPPGRVPLVKKLPIGAYSGDPRVEAIQIENDLALHLDRKDSTGTNISILLLLFPSLIQLFVNRSNRFKSRKIYLFVSIDRIQVLLLFLDPTVCKSIESIQIKNNLTLHLDGRIQLLLFLDQFNIYKSIEPVQIQQIKNRSASG
ncbi:hypothetical protein PSHT_06044 [Puccinia striiformis]|uniref:HeH/LEM domain-containing protein n=2 Tax=cellular organisms TaxID=131567 RepID=A0A2S4W962_9BASI|nr:hypothetical protein PSHT_06044 [Puccinia striiformis]